ncbi:DUF1616 domain-containing protein [Chloroflexota bacterium]
MRKPLQNELLLPNVLTVLLIIIITFYPSSILRIVLGLPLVLFLPGYTLIAALFPKANTLDGIERVGLSFGLSLAAVPISALILNYTPWGIRLYPVLISLAIFIFVASIFAWYRRYRLAEGERFTISWNLKLSFWKDQSPTVRVLSVILTVVILGTIATVGYVIATPRVGEKFTEFYILGLEGEATGYPRETKVGEEERVIVGIINREHETASYRVEISIDGESNNQVGPLVLGHDEKWEEMVSFTPDSFNPDRREGYQKVEFLLYKNGGNTPYLKPLHLWILVSE